MDEKININEHGNSNVLPPQLEQRFRGICMSKYNFEFKLQLVREKEEGFGREFLSNKYGVKYQIPEVS
ncbi:hypothetical protein ACVRW4_08040 [Streptococcus phocae subsp. phocae]